MTYIHIAVVSQVFIFSTYIKNTLMLIFLDSPCE